MQIHVQHHITQSTGPLAIADAEKPTPKPPVGSPVFRAIAFCVAVETIVGAGVWALIKLWYPH